MFRQKRRKVTRVDARRDVREEQPAEAGLLILQHSCTLLSAPYSSPPASPESPRNVYQEDQHMLKLDEPQQYYVEEARGKRPHTA